jgi:hypothetical protein
MANTKADPNSSLLDFLEQLRRERDDLNALIAGIERRLGIASTESGMSGASTTTGPKVNVSVDDVPVGFFHNLSQAAAAEKLLKLNPGHPLKTPEMLEMFRKSGMEIRSPNALTILYTTLKRSPKFERVAGKAWGLADWYPEKRRREIVEFVIDGPEAKSK